MEYINRAAAWVLSIIPEIELEAGLYEVTVPLGVDMMATYCVSVKGTTNFENQSIVGLTIEQQKIVLQSFKVSSDALFENDKYSVSGNMSVQRDGKIGLGETVTMGDTEVSLEHGISLEKTSVKYEVETALNDNLKVASSIEIEKSNNTDMPEWEVIPITVEDTDVERNLMPEHLYRVDGERVLEAIGITVTALAWYECIKWAIAIALAAPTGGASIATAAVLP